MRKMQFGRKWLLDLDVLVDQNKRTTAADSSTSEPTTLIFLGGTLVLARRQRKNH
jgi:hypothetical protein